MSVRSACAAAFLSVLAAPSLSHAVASAELFKTQAYRYGRYEARIQYAFGDGVISSFFLWKVGSEMSGVYWNELDFEKLDADCHMQTNPLYGDPVNSGEQHHRDPNDICAAYHDYAFEWTPTYIAWFIDSKEIRRETGAIASAFADNAPEGMRIHFNVWPGNQDFGGNFNPSILPVRQYISWVQYSSFQNGSFKQEWREEFDGNGVPSGWETGTWASPLNLSTHNSQNVTFVNGIAVLSLTADGATGFTGTPPPDNAGGSGGAPTGSAGNAGGGAGGANGGSGGSSAGAQSSGGSVSTGGSTPSGGTSSAGASSGGSPSGGAPSGGAPTGGATTGGVATGGVATGGTQSGGTPSTGGDTSKTGGGMTASSGAPGSTPPGGVTGGGPAAPAPVPGSDDGSGCGIGSAGSRRFGGLAIAALAASFASRRRRRDEAR